MRTEAKVFGVIAGLMFAAAAVYLWWTGSGAAGHTEWAGGTALVVSGLMNTLCAGYFALVARRMPPRPEDRADAEIADGAGPVGYFAPPGFWPFGIAIAVATGAVGIALSQWWLLGTAVVAALLAIAGMVYEFYAGSPESR
ncbi:aa3-type cytochrome oxidase subunit IV [Dactylosporangium sp. CA-139114]|uniref:aa3-type cytochrome oxidase subunit IV n=1 Tax=Dactylosporangium sp. CA-139114 TaxID=3239931 RepID=UPI003D965C92